MDSTCYKWTSVLSVSSVSPTEGKFSGIQCGDHTEVHRKAS